MTEEHKTLDLDELFGRDKSVSVKWQGKSYEMLSVNAIGPKDALALQKMQARSMEFNRQTETISDEEAAELERMFDSMLRILSSELPLEKIPFGGKMRILQFYTEQSSAEKKATEQTPPTGEKSSQD